MAKTQDLAKPSAGASASATYRSLGPKQVLLVMISVMLGMLLASLDQTIVGTAMPRIIADLNGLSHYTWVFTAYMLSSTVMVPIYGKLSDLYGRRVFFIGGMIVFLAGSALSGLSQDMVQLILFRGLQGFGAAAMMPIALAIVGDMFPPKERGKWQGIMMSVFGLTSIIGPMLGGWITDGWGWRWIFYVNLPIGAVAIIVCWIALPRHSRHLEHKVDYLGASILVAATVPLLLAFTWAGNEYAWESAQIVGLLAFAALLFVGFVFIESKEAEPIINPSLFKSSIFSVSILSTFLISMGMFGAIMYIPLFIQGVIGDSATNSGQVMTPMMLGFIASSIIGGQIMSRTGRYKMLALVAFAIGASGMFLLSRMNAATTNWIVIRNLVVTGLGMGATMSLFTIVVQNAFPTSKLGEVTSSLTFFRSLGGTIGVAILGTVMMNGFRNGFKQHLPASLREVIPPDQLEAFQNPQALLSAPAMAKLKEGFAAFGPRGNELFGQLIETVRISLATSLTTVFLVGSVLLVFAGIVCILLKEIPLRKTHGEEPEEAFNVPTDGKFSAPIEL